MPCERKAAVSTRQTASSPSPQKNKKKTTTKKKNGNLKKENLVVAERDVESRSSLGIIGFLRGNHQEIFFRGGQKPAAIGSHIHADNGVCAFPPNMSVTETTRKGYTEKMKQTKQTTSQYL